MYFAYAKQAFQECEWLAPAVVVGKENCSNCGGETREGNNEDETCLWWSFDSRGTFVGYEQHRNHSSGVTCQR